MRDRLLDRVGQLLPWLLLVASIGLVLARVDQPARLFQLWRPWAEVGILATGMTAIILTGGIDLSIGSIVALASVVLGYLFAHVGLPIYVAAAGAIVVGAACGATNGLIVRLGIAPLVATLATMALFAGLAMALSGGERLASLPASFTILGQGSFAGLPNQIWIMAGTFLIAGLLIHGTRWGRWLYAVGDNRLAARFAAIPTERVDFAIYLLSGLLAGWVAVLYTARSAAAVPDAGKGLELQVIACVVLGGTRVTGGAGGIGRTLLGLGVLAHLEIGLRLLGAEKFYLPWSAEPWRLNANGRLIVIGFLLIAVAIWNERIAQRRD